jgi:large subunit ribosomal protein L18
MAKLSRSEARIRRHKRVRKYITGTAARPRLAVFRSLAETYAQVIDDEAGNTLASASTVDVELRSSLTGKNKTEQARMVGELVAKRAKEKGVETVVFDRGGFRYVGRVKAVADGARASGLEF